jgi:hypothetical protein
LRTSSITSITSTSTKSLTRLLVSKNDDELSNFYKSELKNQQYEIKVPPQYKTNDYMILNSSTVEPKRQSNQEMLEKMNKILEMFEDQKEIKTNQKNEEIVLYCFLGIFTIYVLDSFARTGKYIR